MSNCPFSSLLCKVLLISSLALCGITTASADLVAWWDFENDLEDQTGNHNGTAIGTPTFEASVPAGIGSGASVSFDGFSGFNVPGTAALGANPFTLAYWINPANGQGGAGLQRLTSRGGDNFETGIGNATAVGGTTSPTGVTLSFFQGGWNVTNVEIPINEWTHVAWVNTAAQIELFLNGVSAYTGPSVGGARPGTDLMNIGIRHNNVEGFEGLMDDLLLWDDSVNPLTPADIENIAQNGVAAFLGLDTDSDGDGLPDGWETRFGLDPDDNGANPNNNGVPGDPDNGPDGDPDGDNLKNIDELAEGTNPTEADTDSDGVDDGVETANGTDPRVPDSDGDGLSDGEEANLGTDPLDEDSDDDGFSDRFEVDKGTDPLNAASVPNIDVNLLLELNFDGNVDDQSANGNNGTLINGPAYSDDTPSGRGQSLEFTNGDGAGVENQGVDIPGDASLGAENFTLAYWIKPASNQESALSTNGLERLTSRAGDAFETAVGDASAVGGTTSPTGVTLSYYQGGWNVTNVTIELDEWTHVAWVNNPGEMKLYLNGVLEYSGGPGTGGGRPGTGFMRVGTRHNSVEGYEGLIDDLRLYGTELSEDQIADLLVSGPREDVLKLNVQQSGGDLTLTWLSQPGMLYRVRAEEDLQPEPTAWPVFEDKEDIAATPPQNTLTFPRPAPARLFFVVEEYLPPPVSVFTEDFEAGQGAWTVGVDGGAGTAWEFGTPTGVGPIAPIVSTNCVATNIAADYGLDANIWLRSPEIDLTAAAGGATLNYRQFKAIELTFDFATVNVLDADNGDSLLETIIDAEDGDSFDWEEISEPLPASVLGKNIKLEFRFQSDGFGNFAGWYIDDVDLTVP